MPIPEDVLTLARSQLGVCENPLGSNSGTPYHAWYGSFCEGWQWCAIFVSWVIWHIDQALFYGLMTAYSGDYLNVGRMYLREIDLSQIAPGDICIWDRPVGGITDHIGFVESVTDTTFTTIEGNSGDCVKRNTHTEEQTSSCHYYFVRPAYSQEQPKGKEKDVAVPYRGGDFKFPCNTDANGDQWFEVYNEGPKDLSGHWWCSKGPTDAFNIKVNETVAINAIGMGSKGQANCTVGIWVPGTIIVEPV